MNKVERLEHGVVFTLGGGPPWGGRGVTAGRAWTTGGNEVEYVRFLKGKRQKKSLVTL